MHDEMSTDKDSASHGTHQTVALGVLFWRKAAAVHLGRDFRTGSMLESLRSAIVPKNQPSESGPFTANLQVLFYQNSYMLQPSFRRDARPPMRAARAGRRDSRQCCLGMSACRSAVGSEPDNVWQCSRDRCGTSTSLFPRASLAPSRLKLNPTSTHSGRLLAWVSSVVTRQSRGRKSRDALGPVRNIVEMRPTTSSR